MEAVEQGAVFANIESIKSLVSPLALMLCDQLPYETLSCFIYFPCFLPLPLPPPLPFYHVDNR